MPPSPRSKPVVVDEAALRAIVSGIFATAGCDVAEAGRIAQHLVSSNLAGHDSHGVIRVPRYVTWLREGKVRAGQGLTVIAESPTHAVVDGNRGFGQTIGELAVDLGIAKARAARTAVIALRNAAHIGRIGDWAERAAAAGLVSVHFCNVAQSLLVAPYGGRERRFGTNPFCIGVPMPDGPPLVLDFATSLVAEGKVLVASNGGKPVPDGALIGADGALSTDPIALYGSLAGARARDPMAGAGALRAFGEHKGSGLAFMYEILAGCLTGGETAGPPTGPDGQRGTLSNGLLSFYIDPDHFAGANFGRTARDYADYVRGAHPIVEGSQVLAPGDLEAQTRVARQRDGIPLLAETWSSLVALTEELDVAMPPTSEVEPAARENAP